MKVTIISDIVVALLTTVYTQNYYTELRGAIDNIPTSFSNIPVLNLFRLIDQSIKKDILPDDLGRR
jgi:hypothetical protein